MAYIKNDIYYDSNNVVISKELYDKYKRIDELKLEYKYKIFNTKNAHLEHLKEIRDMKQEMFDISESYKQTIKSSTDKNEIFQLKRELKEKVEELKERISQRKLDCKNCIAERESRVEALKAEFESERDKIMNE